MKVNGSKCRLMLALIKYAVIFVVVVLHVAFLFIVWTENGLLLNSCHIVDVEIFVYSICRWHNYRPCNLMHKALFSYF